MVTTDVQPHDRADDVEQPPMQAISLPQINRRHPRPPPSGVTPVVILNGLLPEIPDAAVAVLAEPDVNQEVAERVFGLKVGSRFGGSPVVDGTCACVDTVPAAELACAFRLVVHRGAKGNDAFDLRVGVDMVSHLQAWRKGQSDGLSYHTLSGANNAILTVIQPPWLVPKTNAFSIPKAVMTCKFICAVSQ